MDDKKIIARHEVAHLLGIIIAGLYNEFVNMTCQPSGQVNGQTVRNGNSLTEYSQHLASDIPNYLKVIKEEGRPVVLRNLCYVFGGGSYDRLPGNEPDVRNSIDNQIIRSMLLPALSVVNVSDERYAELQKMVDAYLHPIFEANACLIEEIAEVLLERGTINKAEMDQLIAEKSWVLPTPKADFEGLQAQFDTWLSNS